jgi:hypothetical protein
LIGITNIPQKQLVEEQANQSTSSVALNSASGSKSTQDDDNAVHKPPTFMIRRRKHKQLQCRSTGAKTPVCHV